MWCCAYDSWLVLKTYEVLFVFMHAFLISCNVLLPKEYEVCALMAYVAIDGTHLLSCAAFVEIVWFINMVIVYVLLIQFFFGSGHLKLTLSLMRLH